MRWSIIRLIWLREMRDQLRDRRTVFMIAVLPVLIYPLAGMGFLQLAGGMAGRPTAVGVAGLDNAHPWRLTANPRAVARSGGAFLVIPAPAPVPLAALAAFDLAPSRDYPPLFASDRGGVAFDEEYADPAALPRLAVRALPAPDDAAAFPDGIDRTPLQERKVDVLLAIPPGFQDRIEAGEQPPLYLLTRDKDDASRAAGQRVAGVLGAWRRDLKRVRFTRLNLPADFDDAIRVVRPGYDVTVRAGESVVALLVRIFPFILVMWSLAGALYPAVDVCAGEKERGTMETLLISPASREEIVWGKFLTIWVFSTATALLNLLSMALTVSQASRALPGTSVSPAALVWAVLLLLPLSAFFSALCLAVGAYARSSKEGQYYLMPLFLLTMPLIFLTLVPGVELNPFYCLVPVTGVALLLQRLMLGADRGVWLYFVPVLAPMVIYSWLALRWAIGQFKTEEVLFREAERIDLRLWLAKLLREKEPLPSAGEAVFCFAVILLLRWISFGVGTGLPLWARTGVAQLAFVAAPALLMAVMLLTRPAAGLALRLPPLAALPMAALLAVALLLPMAELTLAILAQFPGLLELLKQYHPLTDQLLGPRGRIASSVVLILLPPLCEELAFRGFILSGLRRGFRPWSAILLSSFLFALYQMNVFQFVPHFLFGVVLALLVVRTGSLWPAVVFHLVYNALLMGPALFPEESPWTADVGSLGLLRAAGSAACLLVAAGLLAGLWRLRKPETS